MQLNLKLSHKGLILVAVPLLFELVFLSTLVGLLKQAEVDISREAHSKAIVSQANELLQHFFDAAFALYSYRTSKSPLLLQRYEQLTENIPEEIRTMERALLDYPEARAAIEKVEVVANKSITALHKASLITDKEIAMKSPDAIARAVSVQAAQQEMEEAIAALITNLSKFVEQEKAKAAADPATAQRSRLHVVEWIGVGFVGNILLALALALYFNKGTAQRLDILMQNTNKLATGKELNPVLEGRDEIAHLDHVFHDMADALAAAAAHKQELIAMVSHDLRTPLTSIQGSLTLLSAGAFGDLSERATREVTVAEDNTTRLINLINDLLDIERMEAGKLEMHISETEVSEIFDQTVDAIGMFAEQNGISIDVKPTLAVVPADGDRIIQVLVNLISNSVKFSPKGSCITLSAEIFPKYVELRVTDQGRGIPPELIDSIFEKFKQVKKADAKQRKGTGLGLAICKAIVEGHNGEIGVVSQVSKGSTFWFRLPKEAAV